MVFFEDQIVFQQKHHLGIFCFNVGTLNKMNHGTGSFMLRRDAIPSYDFV